jgi:WD40 repeat protein
MHVNHLLVSSTCRYFCACMQLEVDGAILSAGFSSNLMEGLVTTSAATMWHVDLNTGSRVPLLSAHAADILSLVPCPHSSDLLATTCKDGLLRVWQLGNRDVSAPLGATLCLECQTKLIAVRTATATRATQVPWASSSDIRTQFSQCTTAVAVHHSFHSAPQLLQCTTVFTVHHSCCRVPAL